MLKPEVPLNVESLAQQARVMWRDASARVSNAQLELFVKIAVRSKAAREPRGNGARLHGTIESGVAVRAIRTDHERAGFAASSGLDTDAVCWAAERACTFDARASASAPRGSEVEAERWDLDAGSSLPSDRDLTGALAHRSTLMWVEAGTTIEILVGRDGWLAARRRNRVWAMRDGAEGGLLAQRGFDGWEEMLDRADDHVLPTGAVVLGHSNQLLMTPRAAASVVTALVSAFHREGSPKSAHCGPGWEIADEPVRPDALVGGTFDDAGFPTARRVLATDGLWVGALAGSGTIRRSSFRDPPSEDVTNLVMDGGTIAPRAEVSAIVRRSRVIRSSVDLWVLELDVASAENQTELRRIWIRTQPLQLLQGCSRRLGGAQVTPDGPIVPALLFDGIGQRTSGSF